MYLQLIVLKGGAGIVGENMHGEFFEESSAEDIRVEHCLAFAGVVSDDQLVVTENQISFPETDCTQLLELLISLYYPLPPLSIATSQERLEMSMNGRG